MASNPQDYEAKILQAIAAYTDADELRNVVFGQGCLLEQYLQAFPNKIDRKQEIINLVLQRLNDLQFDEMKDKEFANWKRVRISIEHENHLVNHRLNWLFSSQAFLFTAFVVVFNAWKSIQDSLDSGNHFLYLLGIISMVGVFTCLSIQNGLNAAEDQIHELDRWWYSEKDSQSNMYKSWKNSKERRLFIKDKLPKHPPLQGFVKHTGWSRWLTFSVVPSFFLIAWALIIVLIIFDISSPVVNFLTKQGLLILSYVVTAIVAWTIKEVINRIRENPEFRK